jgi:hypothetical protein
VPPRVRQSPSIPSNWARGPHLCLSSLRCDETYLLSSLSWAAEDGTLKGTLALILALAALVLFAPIARADTYGATHPYRDAVNPTPDGTAIGTADDDGDHDDECGAPDDGDDGGDQHQGDTDVVVMGDQGSPDDGDDDQCDGGSNGTGTPPPGGSEPPGSTPPPDQGPTTSATPGGSGYWLWVFFVALAAIAAGTAVALRRRHMRNR